MNATKKELVLAAVVLCLIAVAAEIGLRLAGTQFNPVLYVADRELGWKLRAGAEGVLDEETRQYVRINSRGFHDRERSYAKPNGVVRIAVLGNSWTEALQVPLEGTYSALVEAELNAHGCFGGQHVEVLNFGVAGYSTAQELLLLDQEVWRYHPDVVLVAFYSARDIANNIRSLNNAANPDQSPYFVYRDGRLKLDEKFEATPALQPWSMRFANLKIALEGHVRLLQAVNALMRWVKVRTAIEVAGGRQVPVNQSIEHAVYRQPTVPDLDQAWRVTEGLLLTMADDVKAHGAEMRIVTLANRPQVMPDPTRRATFMRELGVADLSYADARIASLGHRAGIPVLQLAPALSDYATKNHVYLNGFGVSSWGEGHWNETGHRVAAHVIAADLCSQPKHGEQLTASANAHPPQTGGGVQ